MAEKYKSKIVLEADTKDIERKLKTVNKNLKGVGDQVEKTSKRGVAAFSKMGIGIAALAAGIGLMAKKAIDAYAKQELAEKKLEASIGRVSQALLDQASAIQQYTSYGDEAVIELMAMLGAFTDNEEQIISLTQATLDLAAAKGYDLVQAADLVGKSFGSSTNALTRYGIEVKGAAGSTERLKTLTENTAKLFGGQASAQALTMAGSLAQAKNAAGDAAENLGALLAPAVIGAANALKAASEHAGAFLKGLKNLIEFGNVVGEQEKANIETIRERIEASRDFIDELFKLELAQGRLNDHDKEKLENERLILEAYKKKLIVLEFMKGLEEDDKAADKAALAEEAAQREIDAIDQVVIGYEKKLEVMRQHQDQIDYIIEMYPELAAALNLEKQKVVESSYGWETFAENIEHAAAASIMNAMSITSTTNALGAAGEAAKRTAAVFISAEIQKAVSSFISSMISSSGPLAPLVAPAAMIAGAALGSLMGSTIERIKFAKGGIVNQPVFSPLLGGGAIAGEAGAEAIIPLTGNNIITEMRDKIDALAERPAVQIGTVLTTREFVRDHVMPIAEEITENNLA